MQQYTTLKARRRALQKTESNSVNGRFRPDPGPGFRSAHPLCKRSLQSMTFVLSAQTFAVPLQFPCALLTVCVPDIILNPTQKPHASSLSPEQYPHTSGLIQCNNLMQVVNSQSHNVHKAVAFEPLAPAALFLRILITFMVIKVTMH